MAGIDQELADYVDPNLWITQKNVNTSPGTSRNHDRNNSMF